MRGFGGRSSGLTWISGRSVPGVVTRVAVAAALALGYVGVQAALGSSAHAGTGQFRGVNWADPNDNFVTGPILPVGLSQSDSYATVYAKSTAILKGFEALGANTVRMAFNSATTSGSWWNSYVGAFDAASALGMNVVVAPWLQNGTVSDTSAFYTMWDVMINKYGSRGNFYFDIMNEPWAFSATALTDLAATWLARYPSLPRGHVIVPGLYSDQNLCAVGADSRLAGTLLSIHMYTLGGETHPTEAGWVTSFENSLCGYSSRAVLTEFGAPMNTGVNYDGARDGTNNVSYLYALTDTARSLGMGAILWTGVKEATQYAGPGPCFNASCAITSLNGTGAALSLSLTNQSGLDRLQYAWGVGGGTGGTGPASSNALKGAGSGRCLDVTGQATADGSPVELWDCNGQTNQQWTLGSDGSIKGVQSGRCLDVTGQATADGSPVALWDCNGQTNQQWTLGSNGSLRGTQSGRCLDVTGQATADGSALELWDCNGQSNQTWSKA